MSKLFNAATASACALALTPLVSLNAKAELSADALNLVPAEESTVTNCATNTVGFTAGVYNVNEDAGTVTVYMKRQVGNCPKVGKVIGPVSVLLGTADLTALQGINYATQACTLTWAAGEGNGVIKSCDIPVYQDFVHQSSLTFGVVPNRPIGAKIREPDVARVNVINIDPAGVQ